jgi:hypothetical protein
MVIHEYSSVIEVLIVDSYKEKKRKFNPQQQKKEVFTVLSNN